MWGCSPRGFPETRYHMTGSQPLPKMEHASSHTIGPASDPDETAQLPVPEIRHSKVQGRGPRGFDNTLDRIHQHQHQHLDENNYKSRFISIVHQISPFISAHSEKSHRSIRLGFTYVHQDLNQTRLTTHILVISLIPHFISSITTTFTITMREALG